MSWMLWETISFNYSELLTISLPSSTSSIGIQISYFRVCVSRDWACTCLYVCMCLIYCRRPCHDSRFLLCDLDQHHERVTGLQGGGRPVWHQRRYRLYNHSLNSILLSLPLSLSLSYHQASLLSYPLLTLTLSLLHPLLALTLYILPSLSPTLSHTLSFAYPLILPCSLTLTLLYSLRETVTVFQSRYPP